MGGRGKAQNSLSGLIGGFTCDVRTRCRMKEEKREYKDRSQSVPINNIFLHINLLFDQIRFIENHPVK